MRLLIAFALVLGLAGLAYLAGRARGNRMVTAAGGRMGAVHSRPVYHGAYVAVLALALQPKEVAELNANVVNEGVRTPSPCAYYRLPCRGFGSE